MSSNNEISFFKVFNNKYLRNKIFQHVKEIYTKHFYRSFNYYQLPILQLIKSRNETLLIEKLNLYNKHINNNNNNNNNNNDNNNYNNSVKGYKNYKYYLNLNIECIYEIASWKELKNETVTLLFNSLDKSQIEKLDMDKLFEISVTYENYSFIKYLVLERNEKLNPSKLLPYLKYKSNDVDGFIDFIKFILEIDLKLPIDSRHFNVGDRLHRLLLNLIGNPTNIIGDLLLDVLELNPTIQEGIEISDVTSCAISSSDWYILKLLLLKIKNQFNIKIQVDSNEKVETIFGIQVNLEMIKLIGLKYSDVYICDNFDLFKSLLNLDYDHFNPTSKDLIDEDDSFSSIIIGNHEIAEYLLTNYKDEIKLNVNKWKFQFSCIDGTEGTIDDNEVIKIKNQLLFSDFNNQWSTNFISDLNVNQLQFLFDHYDSLVCDEMVESFIHNNNIQSLKLYSKYNSKINITQIRIYKNAISTTGNQSILEIIIPMLVNGYYKEYSTVDYNFKSCLELLLHSIYYDNQYSFQILLEYINDPNVIKLAKNLTPLELYEYHKDTIIEKLLSINQLKKRSIFLQMLNQISIFNKILFNYDQHITTIDNLLIANKISVPVQISNHLMFSEITNSTTLQNLIHYLIQNENYKLFKLLSPSLINLNKQPYIKYLLLSNNNSKTTFINIKLFLYLISIDFISFSNISTIIECLVKSNNIIILNLLLCRNKSLSLNNQQQQQQEVNYKYLIPFKITTPTKLSLSDFNQYINLVHYYILQFSIKFKNTITLDYFNTQNYIFNKDTEKQFDVKKCRNLKLENDSQIKFVKNVNLIFSDNKIQD